MRLSAPYSFLDVTWDDVSPACVYVCYMQMARSNLLWLNTKVGLCLQEASLECVID